MKKQVNAIFSGRVQGVGFRFTVEELANQSGTLGWVKNLRDGRVEVVAEAEEEVLKIFLEKIKEYFSPYIRDCEVQWEPASGGFKNFSIEF
jgi:acylphosphatase